MSEAFNIDNFDLIEADLPLNCSHSFDLAGAVMPYGWAIPEVKGLETSIEMKADESAFGAVTAFKLAVTPKEVNDYHFEVDLVNPVDGSIVGSKPFILYVK